MVGNWEAGLLLGVDWRMAPSVKGRGWGEWRSVWAALSLEGRANLATLQGLWGAVVVHHAAGGLPIPREQQAAELLHLNTERQNRSRKEGKNECKTKAELEKEIKEGSGDGRKGRHSEWGTSRK